MIKPAYSLTICSGEPSTGLKPGFIMIPCDSLEECYSLITKHKANPKAVVYSASIKQEAAKVSGIPL